MTWRPPAVFPSKGNVSPVSGPFQVVSSLGCVASLFAVTFTRRDIFWLSAPSSKERRASSPFAAWKIFAHISRCRPDAKLWGREDSNMRHGEDDADMLYTNTFKHTYVHTRPETQTNRWEREAQNKRRRKGGSSAQHNPRHRRSQGPNGRNLHASDLIRACEPNQNRPPRTSSIPNNHRACKNPEKIT